MLTVSRRKIGNNFNLIAVNMSEKKKGYYIWSGCRMPIIQNIAPNCQLCYQITLYLSLLLIHTFPVIDIYSETFICLISILLLGREGAWDN